MGAGLLQRRRSPAPIRDGGHLPVHSMHYHSGEVTNHAPHIDQTGNHFTIHAHFHSLACYFVVLFFVAHPYGTHKRIPWFFAVPFSDHHIHLVHASLWALVHNTYSTLTYTHLLVFTYGCNIYLHYLNLLIPPFPTLSNHPHFPFFRTGCALQHVCPLPCGGVLGCSGVLGCCFPRVWSLSSWGMFSGSTPGENL